MQGVQPKAKARPSTIAAEQPGRLLAHLQARLAIEERDAQHPEKMQAHGGDDDAGDEGDAPENPRRRMDLVGGEAAHRLPEGAGGRAERHEDGGEAEHEGERRQHDMGAGARARAC